MLEQKRWFRESVSRGTICPHHVQRLVIQAYARLLFITEPDGGLTFATLARFGGYEVRLFELGPDDIFQHVPPLWLELYSHHERFAIDGCARWELYEAGIAAEELIAQAWQRYERVAAIVAAPKHNSF